MAPKRPPGETRKLVAELREQGLSYSQIAEKLGIGKPNVAYHARRLGVEADDRFARRYDWAEIQRMYDSGLSVRQGKPLAMHLHHVNGDGKDNRLENIVFLCGNCHSQTDTYGGRNGHRRKKAA